MTDMPRLHCYGCGRAGRTVLHLLERHSMVRVGAVVNRSLTSAHAAVAFIGAGEASVTLPPMAAQDGLLLALPDAQLAPCARELGDQLSRAGALPAYAFHLSASQPSTVLAGLAPRLASFHPALAFSDPARAVRQFAGSWCVAEGDVAVVDQLQRWFNALGARVISTPQLDKPLYHAAAISASNAVMGVMGIARRLARAAGLPDEEADGLLYALAYRSLEQAQQQGPAQALTGPLERGDVHTMEALTDAVSTARARLAPNDERYWPVLLQLCLQLALEKGVLDVRQSAALMRLLNTAAGCDLTDAP